ncbi:hypothetical protein PIB30_107602, partial [Stylosanthes scabra]|nr:hypothetical protein [Stylosanthes scabra]
VDRKLLMSGRGPGNRRVPPASPTSDREQPEQVNEFTDIVAAIRESTTAMDRDRLHKGNRYDSTAGNRVTTLTNFMKLRPGCPVLVERRSEALDRDSDAITWDEFREEFYKKYFPQSARNSKDMELLQFKKGGCLWLSMSESLRIPADSLRCVKLQVSSLGIRNFAELVEKCQHVDDCCKRMETSRNVRTNLPPRYFDRNLAPQGRNFKGNNQPFHNFSHGGGSQNRLNNGGNGNQRQNNAPRFSPRSTRASMSEMWEVPRKKNEERKLAEQGTKFGSNSAQSPTTWHWIEFESNLHSQTNDLASENDSTHSSDPDFDLDLSSDSGTSTMGDVLRLTLK